MSKQRIRCSREIRLLTNELSPMRRELQILQRSVAGTIILVSLLCLLDEPCEEITEHWQDGRHDWYTCRDAVQCSTKSSTPVPDCVTESSASIRISSVTSPRRSISNICSCLRRRPSTVSVRINIQIPRRQSHKRPCSCASKEAISCCLVPTLFPCISPVWSAVTTQNGLKEPDAHSRNFPSSDERYKRGGQHCNDGKDVVSLCVDGGSDVVLGPCDACDSCD